MKIVYSENHRRHDPGFFLVRGKVKHSAEQPERADRLMAAALGLGLEKTEAKAQGLGALLEIHSERYLTYLQEASAKWRALPDASDEVVANVHPNREAPGGYPTSIVGRAGFHAADTACPIGPGTWEAALSSAEVALTAADLLLAGEGEAYALCRPPGHHAYGEMAGGFCYLNNAALAAERLRLGYERVAILDIDVHHGNGTQGIFYRRGDVMTLSLHGDPANYYPFFWGYAGEKGEGAGQGANRNFPLALGTGDRLWLETLDQALADLAAFGAGAVVIALGLDAAADDPLKGFQISREGFTRAGEKIGALKRPVLLVQEGGYLQPGLGANLAAFLTGFRHGR